MVMSQATLATELENMVPTDDVLVAAQRLSDAYAIFAADASSNGITIEQSFVGLGKIAMRSALSGMAVPGAAASVIQAAIATFWATAATPLSFVSVPPAGAVVPPPNAGLSALLLVTFPANVAGTLNLQDSSAIVASNMYANAIIGGTVVFPPSPTPSPIL